MAMLRTLLADRFGLVAHVDKRKPARVRPDHWRRQQMKPAVDTAATNDCQFQQTTAATAPAVGAPPLIKFSCYNTTMSTFADLLHGVGGPYFNRPVVDKTGLKGRMGLRTAVELSQQAHRRRRHLPLRRARQTTRPSGGIEAHANTSRRHSDCESEAHAKYPGARQDTSSSAACSVRCSRHPASQPHRKEFQPRHHEHTGYRLNSPPCRPWIYKSF